MHEEMTERRKANSSVQKSSKCSSRRRRVHQRCGLAIATWNIRYLEHVHIWYHSAGNVPTHMGLVTNLSTFYVQNGGSV